MIFYFISILKNPKKHHSGYACSKTLQKYKKNAYKQITFAIFALFKINTCKNDECLGFYSKTSSMLPPPTSSKSSCSAALREQGL